MSQSRKGHLSLKQQNHLSLSFPTVMWLTGQKHKPRLPSERTDLKINVRFEQQCNEQIAHLLPTCKFLHKFSNFAHMNQNGQRFQSSEETMFHDHFTASLCYKHFSTEMAVLKSVH